MKKRSQTKISDQGLDALVAALESKGASVTGHVLELCRIGEPRNQGFTQRKLAIYLQPLVSLGYVANRDILQYGKAAKARFTRRQLARLARDVQDLKESIRRLNKTPLIAELEGSRLIAKHGALGHLHADERKLDTFDTLLELPKLAKAHDTRKMRADLEPWLFELCEYLERTTGGPRDSDVCKILAPWKLPYVSSPKALKMWRSRFKRSKSNRAPRPRW